MLILNPRRVSFGQAIWDEVALVAIDRAAARQVLDWSDAGPYPVLADVPEQRVTIRVMQEVVRDGPGSPRPGDRATLSFHAAPAGSDAGRRRIAADAVVTDVAHEISLRRGAIRTITLAAVSPDGAEDPITITDFPP